MQKDWLQHHQSCLIENLTQLQTTPISSQLKLI